MTNNSILISKYLIETRESIDEIVNLLKDMALDDGQRDLVIISVARISQRLSGIKEALYEELESKP